MSSIKIKKQYKKETKDLIFKISFAVILPILTFLTLDLFDYANNMFAAVFFFSALLYTIPFWITAFNIKNKGVFKIVPVIITDFVCLYIVALFTSLTLDLINALRYSLTDFTGVTTLILSLMYLLVFLVSIPLYIYMNRSNKRKNIKR